MLGLVTEPAAHGELMSLEAWFVLAALLSPVGYVLQDVVADAMTVEAVPRVDEHGRAAATRARRLMNTTLQTLGRVAIIGGGVLSRWSMCSCSRASKLCRRRPRRRSTPRSMAWRWSSRRSRSPACCWRHCSNGATPGGCAPAASTRPALRTMLEPALDPVRPNWWILGGSLVFVAISLSVGSRDSSSARRSSSSAPSPSSPS
jgi:hypothetical protein